jgi:hypothetical protein
MRNLNGTYIYYIRYEETATRKSVQSTLTLIVKNPPKSALTSSSTVQAPKIPKITMPFDEWIASGQSPWYSPPPKKVPTPEPPKVKSQNAQFNPNSKSGKKFSVPVSE